MGFLKRLFHLSPRYPSLQPDHEAAMVLVRQQEQLRELLKQTRDTLEVVPGARRSFVLVGSPPRRFGVVWIEADTIVNLADVARESNLPPARLRKVIRWIREAYANVKVEDKYTVRIGRDRLIVTPSDDLRGAVATAINEGLAPAGRDV